MIPTDLFSLAYIPAWFEQLYELSQFAAPEPWRFKQPDYETQNDQTPILERYINQVFRKQAVEYNYAPPEEDDRVFYIRNEFACFHTGLYTSGFKAIYMCFERNKKRDTLRQWYFKSFATEGSATLKYVNPLPLRPAYAAVQHMTYFDPEWEIRVNAEHILQDEENVERLPASIRAAWSVSPEYLKANASSNPKIITGALNRSIETGKVKKRRYSGRSITIGVHCKAEGAYYATPVEYGHGGPAPAPAHPFIRPAYDTRQDEAYEIIREGLRDVIDHL